MSRKYRLGQSRDTEDLDHRQDYHRERKADSKRRQVRAERLETDIESHDAEGMLALPDASPWAHLPEATLVQRHSQWVDLELPDRTQIRATLSGKLKGVKLVCGDRVRYEPQTAEATDQNTPSAQVVAVLPRRSLLKRGGIDDREPWQLVAANADELWICAAVVEPALKPGLLERAYALALDAGLGFRILVTKRDQVSRKDTLPELDPFRDMGLSIVETSALQGEGIAELKALLQHKAVVLMGHSGVGKSSLVNVLHPAVDLKTGDLTKFGTGKQTTTAARWLPLAPEPGFAGGTLIDTPGVRTLSVRGLDRGLLDQVFPELPAGMIDDPFAFDPEDEDLDLAYPERLASLQRLWAEMGERNPNARPGA